MAKKSLKSLLEDIREMDLPPVSPEELSEAVTDAESQEARKPIDVMEIFFGRGGEGCYND
jgi:hypothetical protein